MSEYEDFIRWIGYGHAEPLLVDLAEKKWKLVDVPVMEFKRFSLEELYEYYKKEQNK